MKVIDGEILNVTTPWEGYTGKRVEEYIKKKINDVDDHSASFRSQKAYLSPWGEQLYIRQSDGAEVAGTSTVTTPFLPVCPGRGLSVSVQEVADYVAVIAFYDGGQRFISGIRPTKVSDWIELRLLPESIPANAVYFRVCTKSSAVEESSWKHYNSEADERKAVARALDCSRYALFCDQWLALNVDCKYFPDREKPFVACGVELTYKEAVDVMQHAVASGIKQGNASNYCKVILFRNNLSGGYEPLNLYAQFCHSPNVEVIRLAGKSSSYFSYVMEYAFRSCTNLREIWGDITLMSQPLQATSAFDDCAKLEYVHFKGLNGSVSFKDCPLIRLECFRYMVDNANNGVKAITITVHPDVYSRLTDEQNTEWNALLDDALEKKINFVTP